MPPTQIKPISTIQPLNQRPTGNLYMNSNGLASSPKVQQTPMNVDIIGNTTPLNIPTTTPIAYGTPNVTAPLGTTTDTNTGSATIPPPTSEGTKTNSTFSEAMKKFLGLGDTLATKGEVTKQLQDEQQLALKTEQATKDYNTYTQAKLEQAQTLEKMRTTNPNGLFGGGSEIQINDYTQRSNANLANLAVIAQSSQGLLSAAEKTIKDKLDAQFQPINDQIDYLTKFIQLNNNDLSESEKFDLQQKAEEKKANLALVQGAADDIHKKLLDNNAPASVYSAVDKVTQDFVAGKIDANQAQTQMYQAVGKYGVDPLKALQIQKAGLDVRKAQQEMNDMNNPSVTTPILTDPNSTSILSQTGLSIPAFAYLTKGTSALTRMGAADRKKYMKEAENYVNRTGTDISTFQSQYAALGKTVEANSLRNNQAQVAESELNATIDNLKTAADESSFKGMRLNNVIKLFAGKEFNDPNVSKYAFHLNQLREEFAMYNAALAGQIDANGNIRQLTEADRKVAENIIKDGLAKGGIDGFANALQASREKMGTVLNASIDAQNKQVWKLFGVGDKYQSKTTKSTQPTSTPANESLLKQFGL